MVLSADPADAQSGDLQADRQTDRETDRQTDRQTERQTDRQCVAFAVKSRKQVCWQQLQVRLLLHVCKVT